MLCPFLSRKNSPACEQDCKPSSKKRDIGQHKISKPIHVKMSRSPAQLTGSETQFGEGTYLSDAQHTPDYLAPKATTSIYRHPQVSATQQDPGSLILTRNFSSGSGEERDMALTNFILTVAGVSAVVLLLRSDVKQSATIFKRNVKHIRKWLEEESKAVPKELETKVPPKDIPKEDKH